MQPASAPTDAGAPEVFADGVELVTDLFKVFLALYLKPAHELVNHRVGHAPQRLCRPGSHRARHAFKRSDPREQTVAARPVAEGVTWPPVDHIVAARARATHLEDVVNPVKVKVIPDDDPFVETRARRNERVHKGDERDLTRHRHPPQGPAAPHCAQR